MFNARVTIVVAALVVAALVVAALVVAAACGDAGAPRAAGTSRPPAFSTSTTIGSGPTVTGSGFTGSNVTASSVTTAPRPTTTRAVPRMLPPGDDTTIERVVDGDTIVVAGGVRVRLIGIDTPETKDPRTTVQCFGVEASRRTGELLSPGTAVRLVYDVERFDRYDRTLAYVYRRSDARFVNEILVREGFAFAYTYPPNVAHADEFVAWQAEARADDRGLWGACPLGGATGTTVGGGAGGCDAAYPDVCIPPPPPDLDCADVSPRRFRVVAPDPHRFDGDHDGLGCE